MTRGTDHFHDTRSETTSSMSGGTCGIRFGGILRRDTNIIFKVGPCNDMSDKDRFEIFDDGLQRIIQLMEKGQFSGCYDVCTSLTRYSVVSNYADGMMMSEVFERVFSQLDRMFNEYDIPREDKHVLVSKLRKGIDKIMTSYGDDDKNSLYDALAKMRSDTARFQMRCRNKQYERETSSDSGVRALPPARVSVLDGKCDMLEARNSMTMQAIRKQSMESLQDLKYSWSQTPC